MEIIDHIKTIKKIYMSDSSLNFLLDFERVLDSMDLYTFPNWILGELVDGPKISKYWVSCTFMWPYSLMPDPKGAKRLLPYGARIDYRKASIKIPVEIKTPDDYRENSHKGKLVSSEVWYVDIMLPKNLIADIKQGSIEIAGEEIDLSDLQSAYEKDLNQKSNTDDIAAQNMGAMSQQQPQMDPMQQGGMPGAVQPPIA